MAERRQGLFGGLLRQASGEDARSQASDPPERSGPVEAYEEDWYRSLKALAAQRQLLAEEAGEEAEDGAELGAEETGRQGGVEGEAVFPEAREETGRGAREEPSVPGAEGVRVAEGLETAPASGDRPTTRPPTAGRTAVPGASEPGTLAAGTPATEPPEAEQPAAPAAGSAPVDTIPPEAATEGAAHVPGASPPASGSPEAAPPAAEPAGARTAESGPSLLSHDPAERRRAIEALAGSELTDESREQVAALTLDPDREVRRAAFELLSQRPGALEEELVQRALHDPADEVRAVVVRLAAMRGPQELRHLVPLIGARQWPMTQQQVLEVLPDLVAQASPLSDEDLDTLLTAVGELDSPAQEWERGPFARLAAAIGAPRLVESLGLPDLRRLGAIRLLEGDRSPTVLRAIASRLADPLDEIRGAAAAASRSLAEIEPDLPASSQPAVAESGERRIGLLFEALRDPDPAVREGARAGLANVDRASLLARVEDMIREGDADSAGSAIEVAKALDLTEVADAIMARAVAMDASHRAPLVDALRAFGLETERLVGLVSSVDEAHRAEAIHIVWEAGGAPVLPHLQAYLDDPSAASRMAVLEVMADGSFAGAGEVARRVLETDLSPAVRAAAVRMIGRHGGEAWTPTIRRALQDPDAGVRMTAIEWLPGGTEGETTTLLLQALSDGDERVRKAAVTRLASRSEGDRSLMWQTLRDAGTKERGQITAAVERLNPGVLTELALERLRSLDEQERILAVEVLGWGTTQACVEAAIQALQDPSPAVRRTATASLARLRDPSAAGALGKALGDPDPEVRVGVVRALGVIDDESVLGLLVTALNDPDERVRGVTSEVLTEWSSPAVAKRLAGVLAIPALRESATELLLRMGASAVELLIDVLLQGHQEVTSIVGELLGRIVGVDGFLVQASDVDPDRRLRAIEALTAIGGPGVLEALVPRLSDPDERVRIRAAQLLGRLGDPRAREALSLAATSDPVPEVTAAARVALTELEGQTTTV
ncbi:MAG TPA: HEAT repeat domain-containing protein [Actinomycetota bacterium]|nr:HEAT repeat domain-containing protein [Actinomycetota bacterium]